MSLVTLDGKINTQSKDDRTWLTLTTLCDKPPVRPVFLEHTTIPIKTTSIVIIGLVAALAGFPIGKVVDAHHTIEVKAHRCVFHMNLYSETQNNDHSYLLEFQRRFGDGIAFSIMKQRIQTALSEAKLCDVPERTFPVWDKLLTTDCLTSSPLGTLSLPESIA